MACENDKCEKYGMHHDYKCGVEVRKCQFCQIDNQPERSKREDTVKWVKTIPDELNWCQPTTYSDAVL